MDWGVSIAILDWVFLLALFPVAFFWLRRVWRILVRKDFSEVALKKGLPPAQPDKYAPYELAINLVGGVVMVGVLVSVLGIPLLSVFGLIGEQADAYVMSRDNWIATAGSTLWVKLFASFALSRHAHGIAVKKKDERKAVN
jgi:hypothetical protein